MSETTLPVPDRLPQVIEPVVKGRLDVGEADGKAHKGLVSFPVVGPLPTGIGDHLYPGFTITNH